MIQKNAKDELIEQFDRLSPELQQRVVAFTREVSAATPCGPPGADLLRFASTLTAAEAQQMRDVIHADCEQVDAHGW